MQFLSYLNFQEGQNPCAIAAINCSKIALKSQKFYKLDFFNHNSSAIKNSIKLQGKKWTFKMADVGQAMFGFWQLHWN